MDINDRLHRMGCEDRKCKRCAEYEVESALSAMQKTLLTYSGYSPFVYANPVIHWTDRTDWFERLLEEME